MARVLYLQQGKTTVCHVSSLADEPAKTLTKNSIFLISVNLDKGQANTLVNLFKVTFMRHCREVLMLSPPILSV